MHKLCQIQVVYGPAAWLTLPGARIATLQAETVLSKLMMSGQRPSRSREDARKPSGAGLPQIGNVGGGIEAFDGLRCVGGGFLRHGARALNPIETNTSPWGPPGGPQGGLISTFSFLAGQTKHFQVFYRDDMGAVCGTGQNTSNAITVLIEP